MIRIHTKVCPAAGLLNKVHVGLCSRIEKFRVFKDNCCHYEIGLSGFAKLRAGFQSCSLSFPVVNRPHLQGTQGYRRPTLSYHQICSFMLVIVLFIFVFLAPFIVPGVLQASRSFLWQKYDCVKH